MMLEKHCVKALPSCLGGNADLCVEGRGYVLGAAWMAGAVVDP
jgi:hypothetical protein